MKTRLCSIRVILTVTTGCFLVEPKSEEDDGIGELYECLGWMAGEALHSHQLVRFNDEFRPWLLRWFPVLATADAFLPELDRAIRGARERNLGRMETDVVVREWIDRVIAAAGLEATYEVPRIPQDDYDRIDPHDELVAMRGTDEGVILVETSHDPS